jgi:serine/threonine protein kinase
VSGALLLSGQKLIDRYEIQRFLAEGGMQQVYIATDLSFDRTVAVKAPKNSSAEKRFERSARASARIVHANVAKTLDYFEDNKRNYLVEELVQGSDLGATLERTFEYLDPHLAAHLVHHLAKGVAASHHAGVLHRDLKPSNIIASEDGSLRVVKITDFGIAKMAEHEINEAMTTEEDSITGSQTVMGALPYMSPEMVENPKGAKLPADVWAIGAIVYRVLAGSPPFGTGLKAVPKIIEAKEPAKPKFFGRRQQFRQLEHELWGIILDCLQKDPAKRPTADELVAKCAKICYSDAPREFGTIETFKRARGANGFIRSDAGEPIFFHEDSVYGEKPQEGMRVCLSSFAGRPRRRAFPVLTCR